MDNRDIFISYLKKKGFSRSTVISYVKISESFKEWALSEQLEPEYLSYSEMLGYVQALRKRSLMQHTIKHYTTILRHYFDALIEAELIETNPARHLDIPVKQHRPLYTILTKEQLEGLYDNFEPRPRFKNTKPTARYSAVRNKVATGLMVYQGLDVTALSQLTISDADILAGTIRINSSRTHNARVLGLQAKQIIELDRYMNQTRKELQEVFKQKDSNLLLITGYTHYSDAHRRLIQRLRQQEPFLQSARHIRASVITHWLRSGYNLREVQYMAGHRRIGSTEAYLHNDTESLSMDIDQYHPLVSE